MRFCTMLTLFLLLLPGTALGFSWQESPALASVFQRHGKTGWSALSTPNIGWWVGWLVKDGNIYSFALNMDGRNAKDMEKRTIIGRECLATLGLLPTN